MTVASSNRPDAKRRSSSNSNNDNYDAIHPIDRHDENNDDNDDAPYIVHTNKAAYGVVPILLLLIGPVVLLVTLIVVIYNQDSIQSDHTATRKNSVASLSASTLFVIILYLIVLPKRYEIRSDASLTVVSWGCCHYHFSNMVRVSAMGHGAGLAPHISFQPRVKFATHLGTCKLLVHRRQGWDVLIAPQDPVAFQDAVQRVVRD